MRRDLPLIASLVFDTPLLVHRRKANTILAAIGPRILDGFELTTSDVPKPERAARAGAGRSYRGGGYMSSYGIAVLPILGTLVRRGSWLDSMSGLASYEEIGAAFDEMMLDPAVRGVMLEMDSPGGEAGGCFDLAMHIRATSDLFNKPVWAHANECAASACYALASSANEIWIPTTGEVGSIGVLAAHIDLSEADKLAGQRWTYIFAGEEKVDGNMHEPLSARAQDSIQADVDSLYAMFVDLVSQHRGIAAKKIRDTKARMYRGEDAIESGLANEFGTFDEAVQTFSDHVDELQT
ncbi:S49 family peptidase [Mesorhizobium sp. M6A.T.Cr.TU.017.01.1.1]|uniref:S49 family peptidase n=1 Tax=Mesorhizobium sp. M6A.T.Cr.TU.017.01.1.1 TaxID=2496774 RepID=UPI000FD2FD28|nr:S49 family peptidase [Mesorhizobium sp. M6A.T.Cr.TU.017.01.1.1]RUU95893.1 S49 family peptidase [Mesorhizobium sp. M6A.T.Cr.TU.017.01.1.1]